jgi:hypothetical protein
MATLVGVLMLVAPIAVLATLMWLVECHQRRRRDEIVRQIALTDALHARLGALLAPVVRRRHRLWQVAVAVPFGQSGVVATVLDTVDQVLGQGRYEVVLSRQAPARPAARSRRSAALGEESLSWT